MTFHTRFLSTTFLLALGCTAVPAQQPKAGAASPVRGFSLAFPQRMTVKSAGELKLDTATMNLETFSALCLEPSTTATFTVDGPETRADTKGSGKNHLIVHEEKAALKANPNKEPFFARAEGAISAFTWIEGSYTNPTISGEINTDGGHGGKGSSSRQGLMARWDQGNNFYWFFIDFANGTYAVMRSRFFGVMEKLADANGQNSWPVPGFKKTQSYMLEFELNGATAKGRIFAQTPSGQRSRLIAETPVLTDKDPFPSGISGYLAEASLGDPFAPLHASLGSLTCQEK
jgi:hypothetical protein